MSLREQFIAMDDRLASHGVPPLTAWWREGIGEWLDAYEHGHVLELWACAGRGAAKSTALYKLATFFTLAGDFQIPPGERHFAIVLSRLKEEASKGIAIIDRWLTLLGVPHDLAGDVIELAQMPRGIRVVAASVSAASGWRAYYVGKDERSKWPTSSLEEREADEIDTSASAMTATHPYAPIITGGSAWGAFGGFYDAISAGSTSARVVLGPVPTWVAAPHIAESDCRRKERDPRRFAREYGSEFDSAESSHLTTTEVHSARRMTGPAVLAPRNDRGYLAVTDPATRANDWVLHVLAYWFDRGILRVDVALAMRWQGTSKEPLSPARVLREIAGVLAPFGLSTLHSDQHSQDALVDLALREGLRLVTHTMTAGNRPEILPGQPLQPPSARVYIADAFETMKAIFVDRAISIPDDALIVRDLLSIRRRLTATSIAYDLPVTSDGRHGDNAACLALGLALCPSALDSRARIAHDDRIRDIARQVERIENGGDRAGMPKEVSRALDREEASVAVAMAQMRDAAANKARRAAEWEAYLRRHGRLPPATTNDTQQETKGTNES